MEAKRISRGDTAALQGAVDREPFQKTRQAPRAHNRRLLQQNRHLADKLTAQGFVAYWGKSGHRSALALKGSVANDPKRTLASISCCSSEAGLGPIKALA